MQQKKPPKAAMEALRPLAVLQCAAQGGDWYKRFCDEHLAGWKPRHPDAGTIMNGPETLAWASKGLPTDETYKALASHLALRALLTIAEIANADIRAAFDEEGNLMKPKDLPDSVAVAIQSMKPGEIKVLSKLDANKTLMQAGGQLVEKIEATGANGEPLIPESSPEEIVRRAVFAIAGVAASKQT